MEHAGHRAFSEWLDVCSEHYPLSKPIRHWSGLSIVHIVLFPLRFNWLFLTLWIQWIRLDRDFRYTDKTVLYMSHPTGQMIFDIGSMCISRAYSCIKLHFPLHVSLASTACFSWRPEFRLRISWRSLVSLLPEKKTVICSEWRSCWPMKADSVSDDVWPTSDVISFGIFIFGGPVHGVTGAEPLDKELWYQTLERLIIVLLVADLEQPWRQVALFAARSSTDIS